MRHDLSQNLIQGVRDQTHTFRDPEFPDDLSKARSEDPIFMFNQRRKWRRALLLFLFFFFLLVRELWLLIIQRYFSLLSLLPFKIIIKLGQ